MLKNTLVNVILFPKSFSSPTILNIRDDNYISLAHRFKFLTSIFRFMMSIAKYPQTGPPARTFD